MKNYFLYIIVLIALSCDTKKSRALNYSTSEAVLDLYSRGWMQIMDEGRYGQAETSYRKALAIDPNFLVGKSVLARLTLDLEERLKLSQEINAGINKITGDEFLILEVYSAFVTYTNLRDQNDSNAKKALQNAISLAENNFRIVVHKYPYEIYLKAEYIEILHSIYGPSRALDSLKTLTSKTQKDNPFLLGFAASMYAELKDFDQALALAHQLKSKSNDSTQPKKYAVLADIYFQQENYKLAKINADKANRLDPRNLDAKRLKKKIDAKLLTNKL